MEHLLTHPDVHNVVDRYLKVCKEVGYVLPGFVKYTVCYTDYCDPPRFDVIEVSSGFLSIPADDWLRIVDKIHSMGLKAKPELEIQFGAGGGMLCSPNVLHFLASDHSKSSAHYRRRH